MCGTGELPAAGPDWDVGIQDMFPLSDYGSLGPEVMGSAMTLEYDQHVALSLSPGARKARSRSAAQVR